MYARKAGNRRSRGRIQTSITTEVRKFGRKVAKEEGGIRSSREGGEGRRRNPGNRRRREEKEKYKV